MCVTGVLGCDEVAEEGVMLSDIRCMVSGRPAGLPESCSDIEGNGSSNRSKTMTLGSGFGFVLLPVLDNVPALCLGLVCFLLDLPLELDAYSGRSAKLFGVTTTL